MSNRALAIAGVIAITLVGMVIAALRPDEWPTVVGFIAPTVGLLVLILRVQEYHLEVNSRMDELLQLTAKASKAEGRLQAGEEAGDSSGQGEQGTGGRGG